MNTIFIEDKAVSVETIREAEREEDIPDFSGLHEYFRTTLSFCRQWLRGQKQFILHTSGSTGIPKRITIQRRQMEASARMTLRDLQLGSSDTALVCLNTAYIAGKMMLVRGMEAGMDMAVVPPGSLPFAQVPEDIHIRFTALVPLQAQAILESDDRTQLARLNQLKALLIGGAPVSYALRQEIRKKITAPVYGTYGMTETVSHIALKRLNGPDLEEAYTVLYPITIGTDARGCLTIQGAVTGDRKLTTNDVVHMTDERHFIWIGRADHIINSGGFKIFPERVEAVVAQFMAEESLSALFFIGALPDERLGESVVLVIEGSPLSDAFEKKLLSYLSQQLHPYALPKAIYYVAAFCMTTTGKVNRKQTLGLIS